MGFDKEDHDLLICIDAKLKSLKDQVENHLKHHWAITLCALSAAFSAFVGIIIMLLKGR